MKKYIVFMFICLFAFKSPEQDHKLSYLSDSIATAILVESIYDVPAELTLAQSAHESGWGTSYNAKYRCNYFGITTKAGYYKVFDSKEDCFKYYGKLISDRYNDCLVENMRESISCIHDQGYAEDLEYTIKLVKIFRQVSRMV